MKVTVKQIFQDKFTKAHHYVGQVIEVADKTRLKDLEDRGLVEVAEAVTDTPVRKATRKRG